MRNQKLSPKQEKFILEYLIDLNATQAAIRAGYSAKNADKLGSQLLGNPRVSAGIQKAMNKRAAKAELTGDKVLSELVTIGFSDIGQVLDFTGEEPRLKKVNEIPETARRAISSMKVKRYMEGRGEDAREVEVIEFKLWSKDSALEKLGRHLKLFGSDVNVNHTGEVKVKQVKAEDLTDDQLASIIARAGIKIDGVGPDDPLPQPGTNGAHK